MLEQQLARIGNELTCPIAVMEREGQILTGQRNYTKDKWKVISVLTVPGGRCDPGETLEEALRREVAEEVGITEFDILAFIGEVPGAKEGDIVPIFYCRTKQDATLMEPKKFSWWRWILRQEYVDEDEYSGFNPAARKVIVDFLLST